MAKRVVGTCCCGTPPFEMYGRLWVRIDTTWGDQIYQGYTRRVITSATITYMSSVPAKWQSSSVYPDGTYLSWPVYSWSRSTSVGMMDFDRTTFLSMGLRDPYLMGGPDGDSLDPADWAALVTDLSAAPCSFADVSNIAANNPVGKQYPEDYMHHLVWSEEWSVPFTYDSTGYVITFAQNGLATRDRFYQLSSNYDANEDLTSASWYARYEINDTMYTISRNTSQNN